MTIEEHRTKHITNLLGIEHHLVEALNRQRGDEDVRLHANVNEVVIRMERSARDHYESLKTLATSYGIEESTWKKAAGTVLGTVAGLIEGARDRKLSGLLRDNYVVLSILAMQYTSVHAFAMAVRDEALAGRALSHLKGITPLMVAISRLLPEIVVEETAHAHGSVIDVVTGSIAAEASQRAWSPENVESP